MTPQTALDLVATYYTSILTALLVQEWEARWPHG